MKKLLLTACAITCAVSVFAQGTVQFNNRLGASVLATHVYLSPAGVSTQLSGNGANDFPAGTTSWAGFTALQGAATGAQPFLAALMYNYSGTGTPSWALTGAGGAVSIASFRSTTSGAGFFNADPGAYLTGVAGRASATVAIFAWDTKGGTILDPTAAWNAWKGAQTAGGVSKTLSLASVGGPVPGFPDDAPVPMTGLESFNIYTVPEPSTLALAGLGAAAVLIFRRRK